MKLRYAVIVGAVAALTAACGSSTLSDAGGGVSEKASADATGALKIWLMDGSQPQTVVDAVNAEFVVQGRMQAGSLAGGVKA